MNLHVNMILESEQRSASLVSLKFTLRALIAIACLLAIAAAVTVGANFARLNRQIADLNAGIEHIKPAKKHAEDLRKEFLYNLETKRELDGWRNSRISLQVQLAALKEEVPENIQLLALQAHQTLQLDEATLAPARLLSMTLDGRAAGVSAEDSVNLLKARISSNDSFVPRITEVEVTRFEADSAQTAKRDDRVFQIYAHFTTSLFEK